MTSTYEIPKRQTKQFGEYKVNPDYTLTSRLIKKREDAIKSGINKMPLELEQLKNLNPKNNKNVEFRSI